MALAIHPYAPPCAHAALEFGNFLALGIRCRAQLGGPLQLKTKTFFPFFFSYARRLDATGREYWATRTAQGPVTSFEDPAEAEGRAAPAERLQEAANAFARRRDSPQPPCMACPCTTHHRTLGLGLGYVPFASLRSLSSGVIPPRTQVFGLCRMAPSCYRPCLARADWCFAI